MSSDRSTSARASPTSAACAGALLVAGVFFTYTGTSKVVDASAFARLVESHGLLPRSMAGLVSFVLPIGEILLGLGAVLGVATRSQALHVWAWLSAIVFLVFAGYTGLLWLRPPPNPTPCGCGFSSRVVEDWSLPLFRNLLGALFLALCALGLRHPRANLAKAAIEQNVPRKFHGC